MFLLNLTLPEFLVLFSGLAGLTVAIYLLSRARRKLVVSTLRFWEQAQQPVPSTRRRRIQQPWSLLLQLLSLFLLLLAIAQLRIGAEGTPRDHILLLDASSWMGARTGERTLLDVAKARARSYVGSLPAGDRVMLVRADSVPSPATGMENNRTNVLRAIEETRPGAAALNLQNAFAFAEQIRALHTTHRGEIVYVGGGRVGPDGTPASEPANLRLLEIPNSGANYGLSRIGLRRSDINPGTWDVSVEVRNYSQSGARIPLAVQFGGAPAGSALLDVKANAAASHTFTLRTRAAGWLEARLLLRDALPDDNRAVLELPARRNINVAVFSSDPDAIRPVLAAHPQVEARYYGAGESQSSIPAEILVFDRVLPTGAPKVPAIYFEPPDGEAFRTRAQITRPTAVKWRPDHEICAGIRTRDVRLGSGRVLTSRPQDVVLASVDSGPVALLRPAEKIVALGFHPGRTSMRWDLTTPILIANILRYFHPEVFHGAEVIGEAVGSVTTSVDAGTDPRLIKVVADSRELPFTVQNNTLRFFSGAPGVVRVLADGRERVFSLSLPEVGEDTWQPSSRVRRGVPSGIQTAASRDLWQILAAVGAFGLALEWWLYGRRRVAKMAVATTSSDSSELWRKAS